MKDWPMKKKKIKIGKRRIWRTKTTNIWTWKKYWESPWWKGNRDKWVRKQYKNLSRKYNNTIREYEKVIEEFSNNDIYIIFNKSSIKEIQKNDTYRFKDANNFN